jgi:hypothetical protein
MSKAWYIYPLWVAAGGVLGFTVAAVFAGLLRLPRALFPIPYAVLVSAFLYGYVRWSGVDIWDLILRHWPWGLVGAAIVGAFVVKNVLSQPAFPRPHGFELAFDLVWFGVVYGTLDALLLSIMPVLATWQAFSSLGWTVTWPGRLAAGAAAIVASLLVTAAYHLGYPEFRSPSVAAPVFGNGVMSLGYLLTANPISAIASHIAMHVSAVLHGLETTAQLPPHY